MQDVKISFPIFGSDFILDPPRYFTVFGYNVYWYAVIVVAGFLLAALYIMKRRKDFGLTQDNVLDLFICAVVSGVVGARLYYILFNLHDFVDPGKWLNIFNLRQGGLAVYGGVIAAALVVFIYARKKNLPPGVFFDAGGLGLLIGQAIGRWGNFINREAFGVETDLPWKMGLTTDMGTFYVHPTFLYESLWNAVGFIGIHIFSKKYRKYDGQVFLLYLAWYGFGRFFIEGLRTDSLFLGRSNIRVSQLVAALTFVAAVFFLIRNALRGKGSPDGLYVNKSGSDNAPEISAETSGGGDREGKSETAPDDVHDSL